jgi:catechol 2,3-dioxygenase-like lactoylglutathione lyase family enzyme
MDASVDFYRRYAGLHIVHERGNGSTRVVWISHNKDDPEFVIVLLEMPYEKFQEPAPMDHFGFAVDSREEVDRIAALGVEDNRLKWGPAEGGPIVGYFVMVRDPSGNTCEFSFGQPIHPRQIPT